MSSKEVDLASTLGFLGVSSLKIAEDISKNVPADRDVAKEQEKLKIEREDVREEKLVEISETNGNKPTNVPTTIYHSQYDAIIYPCEMCGNHFKSKKKVEQHLRSCEEKESNSQECPTCSKSLANKAALAGHMRSHEGTPESRVPADRVLCNVCSKTYLNKHILKAHMLTHDEDQKTSEELSCILCPKSFRNKYILKYHMNSHNRDHGQMCNLCSKMFAMKSVLRRHMLNMHSENTHPAPCSNCGLKCKLSSLARHEKVCKLSDEEKEERKVECPDCGKKLSTRGKLRTHIRVKHNGEKLPEEA